MLPFLEIIPDEELRSRVEELYYANRKLLFTIAKSHLHDDDLAEEAIQETFLCVAEKCETLNLTDDEKSRHLLAVITRRRATRMFNKGARNEELKEKIAIYENFDEESPEDDALNKYELEVVLKAVNSLDEKYRDLLYLKVEQKLTTKDIAFFVDKSDGAVRQLLHTARKKVRAMVEKEVGIHE